MLLKEMKAMLHQIGTSQDKDVILGSREEYPELNILTEQFPEVSFTSDYQTMILRIGSTKSENPVFYAPISSLKDKKIKWKQIIKPSDLENNKAILLPLESTVKSVICASFL